MTNKSDLLFILTNFDSYLHVYPPVYNVKTLSKQRIIARALLLLLLLLLSFVIHACSRILKNVDIHRHL